MLWRIVLVGWMIVGAPASAAADVLVVCPTRLRAAIGPWESYRREQGHSLTLIEPPATAAGLHAAIRNAARHRELKYVVLVGDVGDVPTDYVDARINLRWGSEATIATDQTYADVDGDGLPDVAVGRIPADTPEELAAVVRKVIGYEQQSNPGAWRQRVNVVAGVGGFGPITDALIEAAGRSVFQQVVPAEYEVCRASTDPADVCRQFADGCFAWIYLGHGLPAELDHVETPRGRRPILAVADVPQVRCGRNAALAVLVACYTGAIDARDGCLAARLAVSESGPVGVIAATRVSMPYGNTVFGCELLRAAFIERPATLGELWLQAQRQTLADASPEDQLRTSLDALARGVSPPPVELAAERREHVQMYQLLGDPLLRPAYPQVTRTATPVLPPIGTATR